MTQPVDDAETGRIAGLGAGALAGAQLGTVLLPIPFVGTVAGAVVGGAVGGKIGQRIAPPLISTFNQVVSTIQQQMTPTPPEQSRTASGSSIPITSETSEDSSDTLLAQLEQLGKLRAQGVLTEEEFSAAKARLLKA